MSADALVGSIISFPKQRDLYSGDEDELALTLLDIVEPLQYPLSVLQKARRHALASPLLIDGAGNWEMQPLESADQHPAPSQKLPTSKQLTPPAAPASATLLPSASIVPIPLSLNLLHQTPLHSTQTGDSNLVANTTVDSSHVEKVPRQQGQDIDRPLSFFAPACQWQWPTSALAGNDADDSQTHTCLSVARRFR